MKLGYKIMYILFGAFVMMTIFANINYLSDQIWVWIGGAFGGICAFIGTLVYERGEKKKEEKPEKPIPKHCGSCGSQNIADNYVCQTCGYDNK